MSELVFTKGAWYYVRDFAAEAKELGLPDDAGRAEVEMEYFRLWSAEKYGLSSDATWCEIIDASVN